MVCKQENPSYNLSVKGIKVGEWFSNTRNLKTQVSINNNNYERRYTMADIKVGSQVKFVSDDARKGAVVALSGDTATVRLKGSIDTVSVALADLKGSRGRPAKIS